MKILLLIFALLLAPLADAATTFTNLVHGTTVKSGDVLTAVVSSGGGGGAVVRTGLMGEYIFAADGTDTSGSGNNLTLHGSPTFGGSGMTLNGSSQWADTSATTYNFTSSDFTIQFYIQPTLASSENLFDANSAGSNIGFQLYEDSGGNLNFYTYQSGVYQASISATIATSLVNVAVVRSGSSVKIYLNGTDATLVSGTHIDPAASSGFTIGRQSNGVDYSAGTFSHFYIYNRALSSTEVNQNL